MYSKSVLASIVASVKAQEAAINSAALDGGDKQFLNPAIMKNPFVRRFPLPTMHVGNNLKSISSPIAARALGDRWLLAYNRGTKQAFTQLLAPNAVVKDAAYTNEWYNQNTGRFTEFPNNLVRGATNVTYYFDLLTCLTRDDIEWNSEGTGAEYNLCSYYCDDYWDSTLSCQDSNFDEIRDGPICDFRCGNIFLDGIWDNCQTRMEGTFVETSFTAYNSGFWQELKYTPSQEWLDYDGQCAEEYAEANFAVNVQVDMYGRALKYTSYSNWADETQVTAWESSY